ncbi:uncharacterized protein LOC144916166 [Branchiostoma floridae x Branchiostoma belcheri]
MTGDTNWSLRLPGEGKYLCRRTDLGVVTPYPLHVTYRSANWSDRWPQVKEWMPVGPLFSIQCEDVEGPVDILLPHVLHLADATGLASEDLQVVHVVGDSTELLPVTELTPSHAVTRFKKGSLFGLVGRTEKVLGISRNGLLTAFACVDDSEVSRMKVYIVSNTRIMQEILEKDENKRNFALCDSTTCHLCPGVVYHLEGSVTNGRHMFMSSSPQCLMFEDTFDTNKLYEPFRVEVSADIWDNSTTSRLNLELLKEAKDGAKEPVAQLTLGHCKRGNSTEKPDSGLSTPTEQLQLLESVRRQLQSSNIAGRVSVLLVSDEYCTSKGGISTINLDAARKLAASGAQVYVTVLGASEQDERDAEGYGVTLLKPRVSPGHNAKPTLDWLTEYHSVHFPHLPQHVSCIVGHVDVTNRAARKIKEERFPHAKLAMFGHVAPEETEHYKSDEKALGVGRKEASIQDDIGKADVVFSVGARIYRHFNQFLRRHNVDHHIFLPEPLKVFSGANVSFCEEDGVQKPERVILSIGRVRNVERLKGHDMAAGGVDKAALLLDHLYTLRLRVRGIDENDFKESKRILDEKLRSGRVKPTLLPYGTQDEIRRDMENCHLVLMPSRAEPFGLVGLEAITAGVPVLISEHSGLAELIEELSDRLGQPKFRHCIVKMKGNDATTDEEKWAERIEDVIKNARSEFEEARAFKEKLLASKYWEESHQKFLQACGITDAAGAQAQGGGAEAGGSD